MNSARLKAFFTGLFLLESFCTVHAQILDEWTTNQISTNYFGLQCVVYGANRYVAYGLHSDYGVIVTSEDGTAWTLRTDGAISGLSFSRGLVYTGGRFFALGGFGVSGVSTNGIDWTMVTSAGGLNGARGVVYGASKYVAPGYDLSFPGPYAFSVSTSPNGETWQPLNSPMFPSAVVGDVVYGANLFVIKGIGNDSTNNYTSPDGINWTQRPVLGGTGISFCNGLFIIPYGNGTNLISTDGINWTAAATGIGNAVGKVLFANGAFMSSIGNHLAASADGTNWIQYPQTLPGSLSLGRLYIATDGTRLVTVGTNPGPGGPITLDGFVYTCDALIHVGLLNAAPPQIVLSGLIGWPYQIQSKDTLTSTMDWRTNANFQLTNISFTWVDQTATNSQRFYRGVSPRSK